MRSCGMWKRMLAWVGVCAAVGLGGCGGGGGGTADGGPDGGARGVDVVPDGGGRPADMAGPGDTGRPDGGAPGPDLAPDGGGRPSDVAGPLDTAGPDGGAGPDAVPPVDMGTGDTRPDGGAGPDTVPPVDSSPGDGTGDAAGDTHNLDPLPDHQVRLVRDRWGVPHVVAATDRGAGYGVGWAMAEDAPERLFLNLWTAQGRRAEVEGAMLLPVDRTMRLCRLTSDVEAGWENVNPQIRDYFEGFAEGVNALLAAAPEHFPAWAEPIRPQWVLGLGRMYFLNWQVSRANYEVGSIAPEMATVSFGTFGEFSGIPTGSNGWAAGPSRLTDGVGIFSGDPHMPLYGAWRMYEMHVRGASFEAAGGAFLGVPFPIFGHSPYVAWTFTSNAPDHADVYRLTLDPNDPERYLYDGESLPFEIEDVEYEVANGEPVVERLRWSIHGPVTHVDVPNGYAVAYRLSVFGLLGIPDQFLGMATAKNLDEFEAAMALLELSSFNLVAGDSHGSILFVWNGRVPKRNPGYDYRAVLDGTTSATMWDIQDPVPYADLPRYRDPAEGFVQNCNNAPWNTVGENPPQPEIMPNGVSYDDNDTERAWRVRQVLGRPEPLTRPEAMALTTEPTMIPALVLIPVIEEAWQTYGPERPDRERLQDAMDVLAGYDGYPDLMSPAPTLFMLSMNQLCHCTYFPLEILAWALEPLTPERATALLDAIVAGMDTAEDFIGTWNLPWGLFHAVERGNRRFPAAFGQYPTVSLFNCNVDPFANPDLYCTIGSNYAQFGLLEEPIRTWTALPFGPSDDPQSPYFANLTELYARGELKLLPFTDADILANWASETILDLPR